MGIDLLDLTFRIEKDFKVRIDGQLLQEFLLAKVKDEQRRDIRVWDFTAWIEAQVKQANPSFEGDIPERLKRDIAACLGVDESDVVSDAWMIADLGMY